MNCAKVQRQLLAAESPEQPSIEVIRHLVNCTRCQALHRRLVEAERRLPSLPVPASPRRDLFVRQIRQGEMVPEIAASTSDLWLNPCRPAKERGLKKLALAFALAAALVAFAICWWAWPHKDGSAPPRSDPLAARKQERDRKLAAATTSAEKVTLLNNLARELYDEAQLLAKRRDDVKLRLVADFYTEVVGDNLLKHAGVLRRRSAPASWAPWPMSWPRWKAR